MSSKRVRISRVFTFFILAIVIYMQPIISFAATGNTTPPTTNEYGDILASIEFSDGPYIITVGDPMPKFTVRAHWLGKHGGEYYEILGDVPGHSAKIDTSKVNLNIPGEYTVTATYGNKTASTTVVVRNASGTTNNSESGSINATIRDLTTNYQLDVIISGFNGASSCAIYDKNKIKITSRKLENGGRTLIGVAYKYYDCSTIYIEFYNSTGKLILSRSVVPTVISSNNNPVIFKELLLFPSTITIPEIGMRGPTLMVQEITYVIKDGIKENDTTSSKDVTKFAQFSSSNPNVAYVTYFQPDNVPSSPFSFVKDNAPYIVSGNTSGYATITASYGGNTATCLVYVGDQNEVRSIHFTNGPYQILVGEPMPKFSVMASYPGHNKLLGDKEVEIDVSKVNLNVPGKYEVTAHYKGKTAVTTVEVKAVSGNVHVYIKNSTNNPILIVQINGFDGAYSYKIFDKNHHEMASGRLDLLPSNKIVSVGYNPAFYNTTNISIEFYNKNGLLLTSVNSQPSILDDNKTTPNSSNANTNNTSNTNIGKVQPTSTSTVQVQDTTVSKPKPTAPNTTSTTAANQPTPTPTNLSISNITSKSLEISWNAVGNESYMYILERSLDGKRWSRIKTIYNQTKYIDTRLKPGTTYHYRIKAKKYKGTYSEYSTPISATTKLNKPSNLRYRYIKNNQQVLIRWYKNNNPLDAQYSLLVSCDGANFQKICTVSDTKYLHKNLVPGKTYRYKVVVVKEGLEPQESDVITVATK